MKKPTSGKKRGRPAKKVLPDVSILNKKTVPIIGDSFHACKYMEQLFPYMDEFSDASITFYFADGNFHVRVSPSFQQAQFTLGFAKALQDFSNALNMSIDGMDAEPPEDWMNGPFEE